MNQRVVVVEWKALLVGVHLLYKSLPRTTEKASQDMTLILKYTSITLTRTAGIEACVVAGKKYLLIKHEAATTMPCKPRRMKISITVVLK